MAGWCCSSNPPRREELWRSAAVPCGATQAGHANAECLTVLLLHAALPSFLACRLLLGSTSRWRGRRSPLGACVLVNKRQCHTAQGRSYAFSARPDAPRVALDDAVTRLLAGLGGTALDASSSSWSSSPSPLPALAAMAFLGAAFLAGDFFFGAGFAFAACFLGAAFFFGFGFSSSKSCAQTGATSRWSFALETHAVGRVLHRQVGSRPQTQSQLHSCQNHFHRRLPLLPRRRRRTPPPQSSWWTAVGAEQKIHWRTVGQPCWALVRRQRTKQLVVQHDVHDCGSVLELFLRPRL